MVDQGFVFSLGLCYKTPFRQVPAPRKQSFMVLKRKAEGSQENMTMRSDTLSSQLSPLLFLALIFLINFTARVVFAPLMPTLERDVSITHSQAGALFFFIILGYFISVLNSGFVSSRLTHRKTIVLSAITLGLVLLSVSFCTRLWSTAVALLFVGLASGLYLPSAIAILTSLINSKHWGKALAIHELAPTLGFILAPLLSEVFLRLFSWRGVPAFLGALSVILGLAFARLGKGGEFRGEPPGFEAFKALMKQPSFLIMIALFGLGLAGNYGIFTMLPLYLVTDRGIEQNWANTLIALSRISGIGMTFLAGYVTDRLGPRKTLIGVLLLTGSVTVLLGLLPYPGIVIAIFVQPMLAVCFFPAGFAALSFIGSSKVRSVAVSLAVPLGFLFGGGAVPLGIGLMGDIGFFGLGVSLAGGVILLGTFLAWHLKLAGHDLQSSQSS
jgi:NNP family nitrate/nitrite transporter-like MFS transporter